MSRAIAVLVLCFAAPAFGAYPYLQLDQPADTSNWMHVTVSPNFTDEPTQIYYFSDHPDDFRVTDEFWASYDLPGFTFITKRLGVRVFGVINLFPEATAGVHAAMMERLGDVIVHGSPHNTSQMFRVTSSAGVREFTQNVSVQYVPEPSALAMLATEAMGLSALRRRR